MLKKLSSFIWGFIPQRLPRGMAEFNTLVGEIVDISGLPYNTSTKNLTAQFILHLPTNVFYVSPRFISKQLVKAAAMQVSAQVVKDTTINASLKETT
jgi:hypothetical protein